MYSVSSMDSMPAGPLPLLVPMYLAIAQSLPLGSYFLHHSDRSAVSTYCPWNCAIAWMFVFPLFSTEAGIWYTDCSSFGFTAAPGVAAAALRRSGVGSGKL